MIRLLLAFALYASDALAAVTYPTAPRSLPSISVAASLCTITLANEAALQTYLTGSSRTNCVTGGNGPPTLGDKVELAAGVRFAATTEHLLPDTTGTVAGIGGDNFVIFTTGSGVTCPAAGTRVIEPNNPHGLTTNIANFAVIATDSTTNSHYAIKSNADSLDHYIFRCVEIEGVKVAGAGGVVFMRASTQPPNTLSTHYPSYISFERVYIHGHPEYGSRKTLQIEGAHIQIVDSAILNGYTSVNNGDSNAILIPCGDGPYLIQNNAASGLGEILFWGGGPTDACPTVTLGYEYKIPRDFTIKYNHFYRQMKWKRDDATYEPPADTPGTGTVSSSGSTVTFSTSQSGLTGEWIYGKTSGHKVKISSGSGTSWTGTWRSGDSAFSAGENWNYSGGTDMSGKNCIETKGSQYVEIAYNICQNIWKDGQPYDLQMTPREFGWISDWWVHHNLFYNTSGPGLSTVGDSEAGLGLGPSPYATARVWVHDNAWVDLAKTSMQSLIGSTWYGGVLGTFMHHHYGQVSYTFNGDTGGSGTVSSTGTALTFLNSQTGLTGKCIRNAATGQTVRIESGSGTSWVSQAAFSPAASGADWNYPTGCLSISHTTGSARTVTMENVKTDGTGPFASYMVGTGSNMCIAYFDGYATDTMSGKATIVGYTDALHITVDINSAFPDTNVHTPWNWAIGKCDILGTNYYQMDSYVVEHNGWYPGTSNYVGPWLIQGYNAGIAQLKTLNFVFRDNIAGNGFTAPNSFGGMPTDGGGGGSIGAITAYADSSTLVAGYNVLWGNETVENGVNSYSRYSSPLTGAVGPAGIGASKIAFHDPDYAGGTGGTGSVGFTDYPNWDLHITGAYATASHDSIQIGPDLDELYRRTSFAFQGTPYSTAGTPGATAVTGSSGAGAVAGSSGATASSGTPACVRGIIAAFDSGC